jgi:ectoine hydroxylase-related dioxygenase (phytanoyl-CoA dioxygenase family)
MGRTLLQDDDLVTQRPDLLEEYELSPILNMAKGDATVHHDLLVHSAPPNNTSDPRWSYLLNFFDASARYAGGPSYGEPLSHLTVNELFPEQTYPTIYPQQT